MNLDPIFLDKLFDLSQLECRRLIQLTLDNLVICTLFCNIFAEVCGTLQNAAENVQNSAGQCRTVRNVTHGLLIMKSHLTY